MGRFKLKQSAVSRGVSVSTRLIKNFHQWGTILEANQETERYHALKNHMQRKDRP